MLQLPSALAPLNDYPQFLLYRRSDKVPVNPRTLQPYERGSGWQTDPAATVAFEDLPALPDGFGVGYLFTERDPFFFVDIDKCLQPDNTWSPLALGILQQLPGAAVEISLSGRGLHVFGKAAALPHTNKNIPLGIELYTHSRYVALTGTGALGSAAVDCSAGLAGLVSNYFAPRAAERTEWTTEAAPGYDGPEDDNALIKKALNSSSGTAVFGGRATFADLWNADADALGSAYPDPSGERPYDASSADAALAQHLAFWTGRNCERIERIMKRSALVREKWERVDYLTRTITRAVSVQETIYSFGRQSADKYGAVRLHASSEKQRLYAESIRAAKLEQAAEDVRERLATIPKAQTWINNKDATPEQLAAMVTPAATVPTEPVMQPVMVSGFQYLSADQQIEYFKGCVYIQDAHRILTPKGLLLRGEQFNATYGGYVFQLDENGDKTTRKAWDAFTESQVIRHPKAESCCFRPDLPPGQIVQMDGYNLANTYVPIPTQQKDGDVGPFLNHLAKLLPDERDREIILSYMAACVQHKGSKFQWAPLIQGTEGNGKTLLTRCVAFAIGERYTHYPPANEISEKFNEWLFNKLFIGVEDVYISDNRKEVIEALKPMITNDRQAKRAMQQAQVTAECYANFMLNSNHKDAIRKTLNDRRFAVFYTAQQKVEDLARDGMDGLYFPELYRWLRIEGYAIVNKYLHEYKIKPEFNPADINHRAPETSSTAEAVVSSLGRVEQEIMEAIEEGRVGFAGGWISSVHLDKLLQHTRAASRIPQNKRRDILKELGYEWHPALPGGRSGSTINIDEGKRSRLYIKRGHCDAEIKSAADAVKHYITAQNNQSIFSKA